jgi:hypothetical protein
MKINSYFFNLFKNLATSIKENITATVIAAIAAFIPLIVYLRIVPLSPETAKFWTSDTNYDFFSFYKMIWFLFFTLIAIILFLIGVKNRKIVLTKTWIYVPAGIYALTAILSTVFAKYTNVALFGFPDRYEGIFVILGYILVFVITLNVAQSKSALKLIITGLMFSAFIASMIGLFQFIGKIEMFGQSSGPLDLFKTSLGQMLITPREYWGALDLSFPFKVHEIYTTLYNTNFVGSFMELTLMLSIVLAIYDTNKTRKVIFCILSIFIFSNWIGCLSRAGYLGVITATIFLFFIAVIRFKLSKKEINRAFIKSISKKTAVVIGLFIVLFFVLDLSSKKAISGSFLKLSGEISKRARPVAPFYEILDLKITPDTILFSTINTDSLKVKLVGKDLQFYSGKNLRLNPIFSNFEKVYFFRDLKDFPYWFRLDKNNILYLNCLSRWIQVAITSEGFKFFDERYGFPDITKTAPSWGYEGLIRINDRGYIWSRTIPLLKDVILLGNGADTFAFYFPQQDYIAKLKYCDAPYVIIDKPHNMYLQIAMNTGIVSLLSVLVIFFYYISTSIKIYLTNNIRTAYSTVSLGVFLGTSAYMVTALCNDSLISVAPVFWIMLGLGYAVNFKVLGEAAEGSSKVRKCESSEVLLKT